MYLTREESWKENKLGRIYQQGDLVQMSNKRTALLNSTYVSHLGEHRDFITKMDYQLENLNELVFIADGARWIWKWADKTYPESVQIVDFRAAAAIMPKSICALLPRAILAMSNYAVIAFLQALPRQKQTHGKRNKLLAYLSKNQHRMQYHKFIEKRLLIGSGAIESAHRDVLQERMKLSGQRWTLAGFEQMAQLRVVYKNKENHRITQLCKNAA